MLNPTTPHPCFSFCSSFTRGKKTITPSIFAAQLKALRHQGTCKSLKGPGTCRIWQFLGVHNSARLLEPPVTNKRPPPGRSTFCWLEFCWKVLGPVVYVFLQKIEDEDEDDLLMVHVLILLTHENRCFPNCISVMVHVAMFWTKVEMRSLSPKTPPAAM